MAGKRSGGKPPGSKILKRPAAVSSEDRLYALASSVSRACDAYFLRKRITPDFPSAWTRKIDYLGED
jgi:hypothetical protein